MRRFFIAILMSMALITCVCAADTVYLDGTGSTPGAYTTISAAVSALPNGGTVIVKGDTVIGSAKAGVTLPKVGGKVTIVGEGDVTLTFARSLFLSSPLEIDNVHLYSTATVSGNILCCGNTLTIGENVRVTAAAGAMLPALFGGAAGGTVNYNAHLIIKSGTWRCIYGGSFDGTMNGNTVVELSNLVSNGAVSAKNYSGTLNGTATLVVDLRGNKTVTAKTYKETPSLLVDDGYEGILEGNTYMQRKIVTAEPRTVYVDGTGQKEGAYTSLSTAVAEMPGGGTIIIAGNTVIAQSTVLPATGKLCITSKYENEDYTDVAALQFKASLTLGAETVFKDIVLERTLYTGGNLNIIAGGKPLTIDTGVVCLNYTSKQYLSIIGGNYNTDFVGESNITIKSGFFRNVFGGNQYGTFKGNSYVTVLGGSYENAVVGGNFSGDFIGDSHLTFAGTASMLYTSNTQGIVGGTLGVNGEKNCTFTGNIYMTLGGTCGINHNTIGASRNKNAFTKGNVEITIEDSAYSFYSLYAGGYENGVDGNVKVVVNGGDFNGSIFGGSYAGTVTGNTCVEINGGKLCYYKVNICSSGSSVAGTKNVFGGGAKGSIVKGTSTIRLNGGSVYGDIIGGEFEGVSTVKGTSKVIATNGTVFGKIKADEADIDLSAGGTVSIGVSSDIRKLTGGGKLVLAPCAKLTVGTVSGVSEVSINGKPLPVAYISAANVDTSAQLQYAPQENETLVCNENTYSIDFAGACQTTAVTVKHKAGFSVRLRPGYAITGSWITANATTDTSATYTLTPGLYTATVVSDTNGGNFKRRALYLDGRSAVYTLNLEFDKVNADGFDYKTGSFNTSEIVEKYYKETDLVGYSQPDTPYFNKRYGTSSVYYTTNEEIAKFLSDKAANCAYMHVYNVATSSYGYDVPLALFTMDEIPEGATLTEAAAIVGKTKGRDILMINGGTHGNESTGTEGTLAFISELCGDYGKTLLDGTNIGAILVLPRMNPDGAKDFIRETPNPKPIDNLNRDYMLLSSAEVSGIMHVYNLFMPTFTLDCHEAPANPVWSESELLTDVYDAGIMAQCNLNGYGNPLSVIHGDRSAATIDAERLAMQALSDMEAKGLRTYYYQTDVSPVWNTHFFGMCGSYAYILEVHGITGGESHIARRTYAQLCGIRALVDIVLKMDGEMARKVEAARGEVARSAQVYDDKKAVILSTTASRAEKRYLYEWNNPLVGADSTVRVKDNPTYLYDFDTAVRYRKLPTAYVFPADVEGIDAVLALLDRHDFRYKKLDAGTTLTLQSYSGNTYGATLNAAADVTFANGAYLVPVDGACAYTIALLFEPDVLDSIYCSLANNSKLTVSDIYRTTDSYIAAKAGMEGTYRAIDFPEGKTLASVAVDGVVYDSVAVEGSTTFIVAPAAAEYSVLLTFTDGSTQTYQVGRRYDFNGDGKITVADALILLQSVLDGKPLDGDVNGDGSVGLADVLSLLRQITQ